MILDRLELIQTLSNLPSAQFSELEFSLNLPKGILPGDNAPQGNRAKALLDWAETTGPGLKEVQTVLLQILVTEPPDLEARCPYKGLSYFDCNDEDYHYFYGREALTRTLIEQVTHNNFLAIAGASGSGKSSVLRAGLLQHLRNQGDHDIHILVPGEHPLQNLALAFVDETAGRLDRAEQQGKAENQIKEGADGLRRLIQNSSAPKVVLVIDQFEEVFTLCQNEAERKAFFETLMGASVALPAKLCLIFAMRSDFIGKCLEQDYSGLADLVQTHLLSVRPMTQEELTKAITVPAQQVGISLEPMLVETLLLDVEQSPGGLPLLQFTLKELWHQRQDDQLKLSTYMKLGGIAGTLKQRADKVYDAFSPEQQKTASHIFLNLTQLGEGAEDTRRRVRQDNLVSAQHPKEQIVEVVKRLADANLVTTDEHIGEKGERTAIIDVTHEALIRNWPKLQGWLDDNRVLLRQQRKIEQAAEEWKRQDYKRGYVLQGLPLVEARQFLKDYSGDLLLSYLATEFIQASLRQRFRSRLKSAGWLIIPGLVGLGVWEYYLRESEIRADFITLDTASDHKQRHAVEKMVRGCSAQHSHPWLPQYITERLFGNCRPLINVNLNRSILGHANLRHADFRDASFDDAKMNYSDFSHSNFSNTSFRGVAVLRGAKFRNSNLSDALFDGSQSQDSDFSYANLSNAVLSATFGGASFIHADLSDANLRGYFGSVNFKYADLSGANLRDTYLCRADFTEANLSEADLSGYICDSNFKNTDLRGAIISKTDLSQTSGLTVEQLTGKNAPFICNSPLPEGLEIEGGQDRDCDIMPEILSERYPPLDLRVIDNTSQ